MRGMLQTVRLAALLALLLHALSPAGWMPNPEGVASGSPFVICMGYGPMPDADMAMQGGHHQGAMAPHQGHHPDKGGQAHQHDVCPFAAAAHMAPPPQAIAVALPARHAFAAAADSARAFVIAARFSPSAARAPPVAV